MLRTHGTLNPSGFSAQAKHEEELSALRSQLDAKDEQAAGVSQALAAARAALSEAEQVRHPGFSHTHVHLSLSDTCEPCRCGFAFRL